MSEAIAVEEMSMPESGMADRIALTRLAAGVLQGAVLYFLYFSAHAPMWPFTNGYVYSPLLLIFLFVPVLFISGLGHLDRSRIWVWLLAASILAAVLGFYDIWRAGYREIIFYGPLDDISKSTPSAIVIFFTGVWFFIAHALVLAAASDNRRIALYPTYFETSWKLAIQISFSALFVGVLWLIFWLGSSLFMLVKLDFLQKLLEQPWFNIPITAFAFSTGLHITDVRPSIVRGIRTLLLVLMSWLLPVTTLIVAGFLLSLPFTGLAPLWATRHASAVLLGAAAVLVMLINAAFRDGAPGTQGARVLRGSAKIAAVLLLPIALITAYSLGLRVLQYGWTADRVIAAACVFLAACYACGYLWAAFGGGEWLARMAPTNIATAFVVLAVLLALFTPVADPARLSVANQLARLEAGKVSVAQFDFDYLKFYGARYGKQALQNLKTSTKGADAATIRARAEAAIKNQNKWDAENNRHPIASASDVAANIAVWPKNNALPKSFLNQNWSELKKYRTELPPCLTSRDRKCDAYLIDFNGDSNPEILLKSAENYGQLMIVLTQGSDAKWNIAGTIESSLMFCKESLQDLAEGKYRLAAPLYKDLEIGGRRFQFDPAAARDAKCPVLGK